MDTKIIDYLDKQTGRESELFKFMTKPVPTDINPTSVSELKSMASYADSVSVSVSDWTRRLSLYKDEQEQIAVDEYIKNCKDNNIKISITGQEAYVRLKLSKERRWLDYLERLQQQLKDRVILINSLLKNMSNEDRIAATNNVIRGE